MADSKMHRFSRTELLIGAEGVAALSRARVAVIGLGGAGSYAVEALARAGVGWLVLADPRMVDISDTNRQLTAAGDAYGKPKVDVLAERVKTINPEAVVVTWQEWAGPWNLEAILHGKVQWMLDTCGLPLQRAERIGFAAGRGIPVMAILDTGGRTDPLSFRKSDIGSIRDCQEAEALRVALYQRGIKTGVSAVYSTEPPVRQTTVAESGCHGSACQKRSSCRGCSGCRQPDGSLSYLAPMAGLIAAGELIRTLQTV